MSDTIETQGPKVITIAAPSFTPAEYEELVANVQASLPADEQSVVKLSTFSFRKAVDKVTNTVTEREALQLPVPYPTSLEAIVAIIEAGGKGFELLQEAIESVVNAAVREELNAAFELNKTIDASNFDASKVLWSAIASKPKSQRGGNGIAKEIWAAFALDYVEVMMAATGKTEAACTKAANLFLAKLQPVRTAKDVLGALAEFLVIYSDNTSKGEEFAEVVSFLNDKIEVFLTSGEENLLAAL